MLSTLIYRSKAVRIPNRRELADLVHSARVRNESLGVTGILIFDGSHFFQVLEGGENSVQSIYAKLSLDTRHQQIVSLLRDYAPRRKFGGVNMQLFDLRDHGAEQTLAMIQARLDHRQGLTRGDRSLRLIKMFVSGEWRSHTVESDLASAWHFRPAQAPFVQGAVETDPDAPCKFALQPIVDPLRRQVTSLEALIRSPSGGSPQECFDSLQPGELHRFDLDAKQHAFDLATRIGIGDCKLSINLLPMSLVVVPNAVDLLAEQIVSRGLSPDQIVLEITEAETISYFPEFKHAIKRLQAIGVSIAIDDFGAGFAGLSLLSKFQPEKLKIDRGIVDGIHADGSQQAILRSIVECCRALGITTVAEGVERPEEWCWLQAAGVDLFQGYLFAKPMLNGVPPINWPEADTQCDRLLVSQPG